MSYGQPPPAGGNQGYTPPGGGGYMPPPPPPPGGGGYAPPPPPAGGGYAQASATNPLAIISLICGIIGILGLCPADVGLGAVVFGLIGAVLGFIARNQIMQRGGSTGLAMAGLIISIIAFVLGAIEFILLVTVLASAGGAINQLATEISLTATAITAP